MEKLQNVNIYLKADNPDELIRLQVINNFINQISYNYQTPLFVKGSWYTFFFANLEEHINPSSVSKKGLKAMGLDI